MSAGMVAQSDSLVAAITNENEVKELRRQAELIERLGPATPALCDPTRSG